MTLFKKVFQNQARLASEEEALSEKALRDAFAETDKKAGIDPFLADLKAAQEEDDLDRELEDLLDEEVREAPLRLSDPLPQESEVTEESEEHVLEAGDDSRFETEAAFHDAEIVTVTGYAPRMAEKPKAWKAEEEETVDFADDEQTDIAAVLDRVEMSAPEPSQNFEDFASEVESTAEDVVEDVAAHDHAALRQEQEQTVEPGQELDEQDDIVAFAQAQLQAMDVTSEPETAAPSVPSATAAEEAPVAAAPLDLSDGAGLDAVPAPAAGRAGRRAGRVKTRLLGFNREEADSNDPFGTAATTATQQREKFPVGWLVIVEGPGLGHSFSLFSGASVIGRGEDQMIRLDFGDNAISRQNHAAIAYDDEQNKFYIGHGGKSNIIRRNARPVLSTEELHHADLIRIGETTLRFVALCGSDFKWETIEGDDAAAL